MKFHRRSKPKKKTPISMVGLWSLVVTRARKIRKIFHIHTLRSSSSSTTRWWQTTQTFAASLNSPTKWKLLSKRHSHLSIAKTYSKYLPRNYKHATKLQLMSSTTTFDRFKESHALSRSQHERKTLLLIRSHLSNTWAMPCVQFSITPISQRYSTVQRAMSSGSRETLAFIS